MSTATAEARTERPIIFTAESVRAILEGRKTQSRRIVKPQPGVLARFHHLDFLGSAVFTDGEVRYSRYGHKPGNRLWVREPWCGPTDESGLQIFGYRATDDHTVGGDCGPGTKWRSPMMMPRKICRLTLQITAVCVERLQQITQADVIVEGVQIPVTTRNCPPGKAAPLLRFGKHSTVDYLPKKPKEADYYRAEFACQWDAINGKKPGASWADNPWCWVLEFQKVEATQ